jgi:hypothetical protein
MMQVKGWFVAATILAFMAGGGSGLLVGCLKSPTEAPPVVQDADGYLAAFKAEIGITSDDQYKALEAAYDRYWRDLRALTRSLVSEHREELARIDREFQVNVFQQLDAEQRERWVEQTGRTPVTSSPIDQDAGGDTKPEAPDGDSDDEKKR